MNWVTALKERTEKLEIFEGKNALKNEV